MFTSSKSKKLNKLRYDKENVSPNSKEDQKENKQNENLAIKDSESFGNCEYSACFEVTRNILKNIQC
jgi:hypothetical protein